MVPVVRPAVLRTTHRPDPLRAIARLAWPGLLAPVLAPALCGLFTTYASWRWIFLLNVPLDVAAPPAAQWLIPDVRREDEEERRGLEYVGLVLTVAGAAALVVGLYPLGGSPGGRAFVCGAWRSVSLSAYASVAFADIRPEQTADAYALSSTVQQPTAGVRVALTVCAGPARGGTAGLCVGVAVAAPGCEGAAVTATVSRRTTHGPVPSHRRGRWVR